MRNNMLATRTDTHNPPRPNLHTTRIEPNWCTLQCMQPIRTNSRLKENQSFWHEFGFLKGGGCATQRLLLLYTGAASYTDVLLTYLHTYLKPFNLAICSFINFGLLHYQPTQWLLTHSTHLSQHLRTYMHIVCFVCCFIYYFNCISFAIRLSGHKVAI